MRHQKNDSAPSNKGLWAFIYPYFDWWFLSGNFSDIEGRFTKDKKPNKNLMKSFYYQGPIFVKFEVPGGVEYDNGWTLTDTDVLWSYLPKIFSQDVAQGREALTGRVEYKKNPQTDDWKRVVTRTTELDHEKNKAMTRKPYGFLSVDHYEVFIPSQGSLAQLEKPNEKKMTKNDGYQKLSEAARKERQGAGILFLCPATKRILLLKRSMETHGEPGSWAGIGGSIDPDENPPEAARREAREEIGYNYRGKLHLGYVWSNPNLKAAEARTKGQPDYAQPLARYFNFLGVVDEEFDPPYLNWENTDFGWFSLDKLPSPTHSGIKELLSKSRGVISQLMTTSATSEKAPKKTKSRVSGKGMSATRGMDEVGLPALDEEAKSSDGATSQDKFGRFLFAPERADTPKPKEENNASEERLQSALNSMYWDNDSSQLRGWSDDLLRNIAQGKYKNMLKPNPGTLAYRFMSLDYRAASKVLGISVEEIKNSSPNQAWYVTGCPNYVPTRKLSSWTVDPEYSAMGDFVSQEEDDVAVVLVARTDGNNFILNPEEMARTGALKKINSKYWYEMETIGVGPIKVLEAAFINRGNEDMALTSILDLQEILDRLKIPSQVQSNGKALVKKIDGLDKKIQANLAANANQLRLYLTFVKRQRKQIRAAIDVMLSDARKASDYFNTVWADLRDTIWNIEDRHYDKVDDSRTMHNMLMKALALKQRRKPLKVKE